MLENISKSQLKMFKDVQALPNSTRNSRKYIPEVHSGEKTDAAAYRVS